MPPASWSLLRRRPLLIFAGSVLLLQLANAAMLPLMAGVVTTRSSQWAPVLIAFCIIVPQAIVALAAPWVGRMAQRWGRRPFLLAGFGALAIRGLLFSVVTDPYLLVAAQIFDGITAAVFAVMIPLIVADVAFGSGHFNLAQGIVGTATGIGASLSTVLGRLRRRSPGNQRRLHGARRRCGGGPVMILLVMPETRRSAHLRHSSCLALRPSAEAHMLGIPRRFSHFVFGFIQSGLTCAVAAAIASYPVPGGRNVRFALAAILDDRLDHDDADRVVRSARYQEPDPHPDAGRVAGCFTNAG